MKKAIAGLIALVAIAVLPLAIMTAYMNANGILVTGKVVEKREAIVMPGGDSWKHVYEIRYEYQPHDSPFRQTDGHRVAASLYRSLRVGSAVPIRYSPIRFRRLMVGVGSFIVGSSAFSRLPYGPSDARDMAEIGGIVIAALIGFIAYRMRNKTLGVAAAVIGATCVPVILLAACGLILFPALFWGWRRNPGKGHLWALLMTIALCAAVVYWRMPQPNPMPPGPLLEGSAIVRQVKVVDQIWSTANEGPESQSGGQNIRQPFQMLDLEFTPKGASESIHVLDRIDLDSVPGLREGAKVPIYYSATDPSLTRVAAGSRNYPTKAAVFLLALAYGLGAVMTFVVFPVANLAERIFRGSPGFSGVADSKAAFAEWSRLSADDPRRRAFEQIVRTKSKKDGDG